MHLQSACFHTINQLGLHLSQYKMASDTSPMRTLPFKHGGYV